mmetsp:Transcript_34140/g.59604  ORF Transcript_34140/g.59604 Transcript_34140/m.59604 type:complete len:573 (+) Transcript_34140:1-1719(+)
MERLPNRKLASLIATDLDQASLGQALEDLDKLVHSYPLDSNVKDFVSQRNLSTFKAYLASFKPLATSTATLASQTGVLAKHFEDLSQQLDAIVSNASECITAGKKLQADKKKLENRSAVVAAVLEKTQLSEAEYKLLIDQGADVNAKFFDTLEKLLALQNTSLLLEGNDMRVLKLGLDDYISHLLEAAFERLFRYVQFQCKILENESFELLPGFHTAVKLLRGRPVYYEHCRNEILTRRQGYLQKTLLELISSQGARASVLKIGEVLAWLYSALASEHQLLEGLLGSVESVTSPTEALQETTILDVISDCFLTPLSSFVKREMPKRSFLESFQCLSMFNYYIQAYTEKGLLTFTSKLIKEFYQYKELAEEGAIVCIEQTLKDFKRHVLTHDLSTPKILASALREFEDAAEVARDSEELKALLSKLLRDFIMFLRDGEAFVTNPRGPDALKVFMLNMLKDCWATASKLEVTVFTDEVHLLEQEVSEMLTLKLLKHYDLDKEGLDVLQQFSNKLLSFGRLESHELSEIQDALVRARVLKTVTDSLYESYRSGYEEASQKEGLQTPETIQAVLLA